MDYSDIEELGWRGALGKMVTPSFPLPFALNVNAMPGVEVAVLLW